MIKLRSLKRSTIVLVNIILSVLIVKWLWFHIDLRSLIDESLSISKSSIILTMILSMLLYLVYGFRLAVLLGMKFLTTVQIVIMGFGLNVFLPFRLGDVLKIIFAKNFFNIDLSKTSFATIIEKLLDLTVISFLSLMFITGSTNYIPPLLFLFICASVFPYRNGSLFKIAHPFATNLMAIIKPMMAKNKHKPIIFCTIAIWSITCFVFYMFFNMNMISGVSFGFLDAVTLLVFTTLSLSIPSMPASIGLFESGIVFYLTSHFHFLAEKALAYAIIFHLLIVIPQIFLTIVILLINTLASEKFRVVYNEI